MRYVPQGYLPGCISPLSVKEFQEITTALPILDTGAQGTVGPPTGAPLTEITIELAPCPFFFQKLFQHFP